jgi:hypothetical protein
LSNFDNSCYANCTLQVVIHLNHFFSETVDGDPDRSTSSFRSIFLKYFEAFKGNSTTVFTSERLRQFVAGFPIPSTNHHYLNNSMQDSFLFFNDMMSFWPEILRDRFKLMHCYKLVCQCGHEKITNLRPAHQITIRLNPNDQLTYFSNLFVNTGIYECELCNMSMQHDSHELFRFPYECQFVLLYVHNFNNLKQRINSILAGYNPDEITFPCDPNDIIEKFIIRAAVIRIGDPTDHGHFFVWCRNRYQPGWTCLNDTTHQCHETLPEKLESVQYFVLEKVAVNIASLTANDN